MADSRIMNNFSDVSLQIPVIIFNNNNNKALFYQYGILERLQLKSFNIFLDKKI
jgi:hypothetical protein